MAGTQKTVSDMETWAKTATDRDIQVQMLRVAIETRDKIETIRSIAMFMFLLWIVGLVLLFLAGNSDSGGL